MTCSALVHSEPRSTRRQSEHVIKSVRDSACRHGRRSGIEQCIVELEEARVGAAHGPLAEHEVEEARLAFAHTAQGRDPPAYTGEAAELELRRDEFQREEL
jgi:hypothetical protein